MTHEHELQILGDAMKVHGITPEELSRPNVPTFRYVVVTLQVELLTQSLPSHSLF